MLAFADMHLGVCECAHPHHHSNTCTHAHTRMHARTRTCVHAHAQGDIMPTICEALSRIADERPANPLRVLGEHLIKEAQKVGVWAEWW